MAASWTAIPVKCKDCGEEFTEDANKKFSLFSKCKIAKGNHEPTAASVAHAKVVAAAGGPAKYARVQAEHARVQAEHARVQAEHARVQAEARRVQAAWEKGTAYDCKYCNKRYTQNDKDNCTAKRPGQEKYHPRNWGPYAKVDRNTKIIDRCDSNQPYATAVQKCAAKGGRLCSLVEFKKKVGKQMPDECNINAKHSWTSVPCTPDGITPGHIIAKASNGKKDLCKVDTKKARIMCCADNVAP